MAGIKSLAVLVLLLSLVYPLLGEQCKPQDAKPCAAECNGTFFDLSSVKDLPLGEAGFGWSPCKGMMCGSASGISGGCAVCQAFPDTPGVCCGNFSNPVWIWERRKMRLSSWLDKFPDWQIEYTNGVSWRMSLFSFVVMESQEKTILQFAGEDNLTYHFHVIGRCIGQQTPECTAHTH